MAKLDEIQREVLTEIALQRAVDVATLAEEFDEQGDIVLSSIAVANIIPVLEKRLGIRVQLCDAQSCGALTSARLFSEFLTERVRGA